MLQACNRQNACCVPLYDTLGEAAVLHALDHADVRLAMPSMWQLPSVFVHPGAVGLQCVRLPCFGMKVLSSSAVLLLASGVCV